MTLIHYLSLNASEKIAGIIEKLGRAYGFGIVDEHNETPFNRILDENRQNAVECFHVYAGQSDDLSSLLVILNNLLKIEVNNGSINLITDNKIYNKCQNFDNSLLG